MTRTLISGDQKLWEAGHDGGLPDFCAFDPAKTDCSVWKLLDQTGNPECWRNRFVRGTAEGRGSDVLKRNAEIPQICSYDRHEIECGLIGK